MRIERLHQSKAQFVQSYTDGVILSRTAQKRWNLAFYRDLAPTVPYQIQSIHVIEGGKVSPKLTVNHAKRLLSVLKSVFK